MKRTIGVLLVSASLSSVPRQVFDFTLTHMKIFNPQSRVFIGAGEVVANNDFAVAAATGSVAPFRGLTPKKVTLNGTREKDNPLHGQAIAHLQLLERNPVVITESMPSTLHLIDDRQQTSAVTQSEKLNDALGEEASEVLALETLSPEVTTQLAQGDINGIFAAVPNQSGTFTGNGSGIALAYIKKASSQQSLRWDNVDAQTGLSGGNKAKPFGLDTSEAFIGSSLAAIENQVALHFDRDLGLLYIGIRGQSGSNGSDGIRSIVVASPANGRLTFKPIAPDSAFDMVDRIAGKKGSSVQSSVFALRTMQTRTHLRYIVVVGGTGQSVFALPLVDADQSPFLGMLADTTGLPATTFGQRVPNRFLGLTFFKPAQQPDHLFTTNDAAAQVGGGAQLPGAIQDISVAGEAVFVSCAQSTGHLVSGIFSSQPIFDQFGRIVGWTDWRRVTGAGPRGKFAYSSRFAQTWHIGDDGKTIFQTQFVDNDPVSNFVSSQLPKKDDGVQGLVDFPCTTEGFSDGDERLSVQLYTGLSKVLLMQTGKVINGLFTPQIDLDDTYSSFDGSMNGFSGAATLALSGGALDQVGPLVTAAVVSDGTYSWFVVAGSGGIAILADAEGNGWLTSPGLGAGFTGLTAQHRWHHVHKTLFIRKLISLDGKLFALSDEGLERLDVTPQAIVSGQLSSVILAMPFSQEHTFSDFHLKGPLGILATSKGLFRSGNAVDVSIAESLDDCAWTPIDLPESGGSLTKRGPVMRLFPVIHSSDEVPENMYVLAGSVGLSQSFMYRLVISLTDSTVNDLSAQLFPDYIVARTKTFFLNPGDYRNYVATDGAFIAFSRSAFGGRRPFLELMPATVKSGEFIDSQSRTQLVTLPESAQTVGQMIRCSASGNLVVPGDFGIRIQQ